MTTVHLGHATKGTARIQPVESGICVQQSGHLTTIGSAQSFSRPVFMSSVYRFDTTTNKCASLVEVGSFIGGDDFKTFTASKSD